MFIALAAGVASVLERIRNLHLALQHQRRSEELVRLAPELVAKVEPLGYLILSGILQEREDFVVAGFFGAHI